MERSKIEMTSTPVHKRTRTVQGEYARNAALLLGSGFRDYLAARVLLFNGLPQQAAGIAALAVEKHLKAIIAMRHQSYGKHLNSALLSAVRQTTPKLIGEKVNVDFLTLLQRCYKLRYLDSIRPGFNLVVASNEFLAELDLTIFALREGFTLTKQPTSASPTSVHGGDEHKDSRYTEHNIALSGADRRIFTGAKSQWVYEVRAIERLPLFEMLYLAKAQETDGNFLRQGLIPKDQTYTSFELSFTPMDQSRV